MPYASELVALIDADTRRFDQKAAGVDRALKKLASSDPEVTVSVDDTRAQADIRGVEAALAGIEDETVDISADAADARAEVQTVEAALAGIEDETVGISADAAQARGEVQGVSAALAAIGDETVAVTANAAQARAEVQTVEAALAGIEDQDVRVTADTQSAQADVQSLEASLAGLEDQTVQVTAQTSGMGSAFGAATGQSAALGGTLGGVVGKVGALKAGVAGLAGSATAGGFFKLGKGALEAADAVNATNVVFGESRDIIDLWAKDAVDRVGLSEKAFRDLAAPLASTLRSMGAVGDEVANMSTEVISLGADFASVLGGSTQDAVMAIGSAFRGETEPIRRYGVSLNAAMIQERALAMGLVDSTGKIKDKAKVVRDLIVEQATANGIVGDFNRTNEEGINTLRGAGAAIEDAAVKWGELFAPAVESGAKWLKEFAEDSVGAINAVRMIGGAIVDFTMDWTPLGWAIKGTGAALSLFGDDAENAEPPVRDLTAEQYNLAESLRTGRPLADDMAGAVGGVGDAADDARAPVDKFKDALNRLIGINLDAESAQIRFEEALHTVTGSLKENTHHLDSNSAEALKARGDVVSLGEAALRTAESMTTEGAKVGEVSAQLLINRQRMIDHMVQGGVTRAEAERFIGALGFTEQNLKQVAGEMGLNTDKLRTMAGATQETTTKVGGLTGRLFEAAGAAREAKGKADDLRSSVDVTGSSAVVAGGKFGGFRLDVLNVPGDKTVNVHTPGLGPAVGGMRELSEYVKGIGREVSITVRSAFGFGGGDGPGGPAAPRGGPAINRVRAILGAYPGTRITSTYRTPAQNRAVGGSPTSYHMDKFNPAVDIGGPKWQLDRIAAALRASGGWRELLWRTKGHYDHVHVAHTGGVVGQAGMEPFRPDEVLIKAQVGEGILSRSDMAALASSGGSSAPVVGGGPTFNIVVNIAPGTHDPATVRQMAYDAAKAGTAEAFAEERRRNLAMNGRR